MTHPFLVFLPFLALAAGGAVVGTSESSKSKVAKGGLNVGVTEKKKLIKALNSFPQIEQIHSKLL